jgi:hypothetical protein
MLWINVRNLPNQQLHTTYISDLQKSINVSESMNLKDWVWAGV